MVFLKFRWLPVILLASVVLSAGCSGSDSGTPSAPKAGGVPEEFKPGEAAFTRFCMGCHGPAASGTSKGPSFINKIYEPSHHGDASFNRAVRMGVRAHHWQFGNMPKIDGVTDQEVGEIIGYVRWLQRQAGIH